MRYMRMTSFPLLEEIQNEYVELRQLGNDRSSSVQKLMDAYKCELEEGWEDAQLFWIALADAQYYRKELTAEVAQHAIRALELVEGFGWNITPGDLNRRREHYAKAPMPERKYGKPKSKFRCSWKIGDTFAYQMVSDESRRNGIYGKYMLLHKVAEAECNGGIYPVVTVSLASGDCIPMTKEAYEAFPLIKLQTGGRCFSPKDKFEYRTVILIKSVRQLHSLSLQYCGRFPDVSLPIDEIIFNRFGEMMITLADNLEEDLVIYWKRNNCIVSMIQQE